MILGGERAIELFGLGLANAVFLDALIVRCILLPAILHLLGPRTWAFPQWLDHRLPRLALEHDEPAPRPALQRAAGLCLVAAALTRSSPRP